MSLVAFTVPGVEIPVFDNGDGSFSATSQMMIDGDGPDSLGLSKNDPDWQPTTTYQPNLDADIDPYFVLPPICFLSVAPMVIGCQGQVEIIGKNLIKPAVVGDSGPHFKIGEDSIFLAEELGVPDSPTTGGSNSLIFRYTWWPGKAAVINGKTYILQPYSLS